MDWNAGLTLGGAGFPNGALRPEGAQFESPGQRPGEFVMRRSPALKGLDLSRVPSELTFSRGAAPGYQIPPRWGGPAPFAPESELRHRAAMAREKALAIRIAITHRRAAAEVNTPNVSETAPLEERTRWFVQEVHPHDAALKKYLRGSFPSVRDVEDLVQESYLRVWQRHLLRPLSSARCFLYRVARNLAVDTLRRATISPVACVAEIAELPVADGQPDAAAITSVAEETAILLEAIESLPPRCREVLVLRKLGGLSIREIAHQLGISEGTVELHGAKGMRRCANYLRERNIAGKGNA